MVHKIANLLRTQAYSLFRSDSCCEDAGGTATDVTVRDITQHSGCQTGNGIRANARSGTARTVTLTHVTVTGFQKNGVTGSGRE